MSAALLDDIAGLVVAAIMSRLFRVILASRGKQLSGFWLVLVSLVLHSFLIQKALAAIHIPMISRSDTAHRNDAVRLPVRDIQ
jgi:hypothetical protein